MRLARRFARATGGAIAIEFAFCLPMVLVLLFGMVELGQLIVTQHRSENAAATVGDVIARASKLTDTQEADVFNAASTILGAAVSGKPDLRVGQIAVNAAGVARWEWADLQGTWFTLPARCAPVSPGDVPGLSAVSLSPSARVVVSQIHYTWSSPLDFVLQKPIDLTSAILSSPRRGGVTRVTSQAAQPCS